jgi:hypothetical protein
MLDDTSIIPVCIIELLWPLHRPSEKEQRAFALRDVFAIINEVCEKHRRLATETDPVAWPTVILKRNDGERLQVGLSDEGWLLIVLPKGGGRSRIVRGNLPSGNRVVFLLPEWTDFDRKHVISPRFGAAAVDAWLHHRDPGPVAIGEK